MPDLRDLRTKLDARFDDDMETEKPSLAVDIWLAPETPIKLTIQTEDDDGAYRTSVLRIGKTLGGVDIFAKREDLVRLLTAIATHLDMIDLAEQGGPGDVAALFAESMRRELARSESFEAPGHWQGEAT